MLPCLGLCCSPVTALIVIRATPMSFYRRLRLIWRIIAGIIVAAGSVLAVGVNYKNGGLTGLRELIAEIGSILGIPHVERSSPARLQPASGPPIPQPVAEPSLPLKPTPPAAPPVSTLPSYSIAGQWHWRANCGIAGAWHGSFQFDEPSKNTFKGTVTENIVEPGPGILFGACSPPIKIRDGNLEGDSVSFVKEVCGGERPQSWRGTIKRESDDLLHMSGTAIVDSSRYIPQRDWLCTWTADQFAKKQRDRAPSVQK
jgi:hypothetical protein